MSKYKEIPILFQTEMVQAIMEGKKTQTRRTRGLEDVPLQKFDAIEYMPDHWGKRPWVFSHKIQSNPDRFEIKAGVKSIYGKPGDLLWVRETFCKVFSYDQIRTEKGDRESNYKFNYFFKGSIKDGMLHHFSWKPSIHMPKAAARIWLMVEKIGVERLQDISGDDIFSEGVVVPVSENNTIVFTLGKKDNAINFLPEGFAAEGQPKLTGKQILFAHWAELWCEVNGRESWDNNPWVWVVKFRVLSKTGRPSDEVILENWKEVTNG